MLQALGITVHFGGVPALADVDLTLYGGRCTALVGENGAGKSTLAKVISGLQSVQNGIVLHGDAEIELGNPRSAHRSGIALVPQEPAILPHLTVAENIGVTNRSRRWAFVIDWKQTRKNAEKALAVVHARFSPNALAESLSVAEKHLLSLARALATNPSVLILDEVTSALSPEEVAHLRDVVRELTRQGRSVVIVTHRLDEVMAFADDVLVLRDGKRVAQRPIAELSTSEIIRLMLGREVEEHPRPDTNAGEVALRISDFTRIGYFQHVTIEIRYGEIVGLAGLTGAGRSELARSIMGIDPYDRGELTLNGKPYRPRSPREALRAGVVYVPEDRLHDGLIQSMSIRQNISLPLLPALSPRMTMQTRREKATANAYLEMLQIKATSVEQPVRLLSGGNQQKVLLSKWLSTSPSVMILDEPTRGVDVGTKAEIHRRISELTVGGMAILMISSELEELIGMSDRVFALFEGESIREFKRDIDLNASALLRAMNGIRA